MIRVELEKAEFDAAGFDVHLIIECVVCGKYVRKTVRRTEITRIVVACVDCPASPFVEHVDALILETMQNVWGCQPDMCDDVRKRLQSYSGNP